MDILLAWDVLRQGRKTEALKIIEAGKIIKVFHTLIKGTPSFNFDESRALCVESAANLCREEKNAEALQKFEEIIESIKFSRKPDRIAICEISIIIVSILEKLGRQDEATNLQKSILVQLNEYSEMLGVICNRYNVYEDIPSAIRIYLCMMAILDPLHESIIFMLSAIGRMLTSFGKPKEAIKLNRKLYETCLADLCPGHEVTVYVCISLILAFQFLGDFELASIYIKDLHGRRAQLSDTRSELYNEITQIMEYQYADILYEEGRFDEALAKYKSVHAFQRDKLKDHEKLTIDVKRMILKTLLKKNYESINLGTINKVWDIPEGISRERIIFLSDLAEIQEERGNYNEALILCEEIHEITSYLKYDTINIETLIAIIIADKDPEEALKRFLTIKEKFKAVRNPEYLLSISYLRGIAKAYQNKGNHQFAIKIYEKIAAEIENTLLPFNLTTLSIKHDLGKSYYAAKRFEDAKKTFLGVRSLRYAVYNHSIHPHCLDIDADIARVELEIGDASEAFKIYCKVYEHTRLIYGNNHPKTFEIGREMRNAAERISVPEVTSATINGSEANVSFWISRGQSVNARNPKGLAPLHIACDKNYSKIHGKNEKMVLCLLNLGANYEIENWEFQKPCDIAQDEPIKKILEGVDVNFQTITGSRDEDNIAFRTDDMNVFTVNATDKHGNTCLHYATERGFATAVIDLLHYRPSVTAVTSKGYQVFHLAAREGRYEILETLLKHVLSYESEKTYKKMINNNKNVLGYTPLHFAVRGNHLPIIDLLLKHGANSTIKCIRGKLPVDLSLREDTKRLLCAGRN